MEGREDGSSSQSAEERRAGRLDKERAEWRGSDERRGINKENVILN